MSKSNEYRQRLAELDNWIPYLKQNSGLPGPRGNLELAQAVSELASEKQIEEFLAVPIEDSPENTPQVFLVFCGVVSLGRLIACGNQGEFNRLRGYASDPRWRIREATAIALQTVGERDMPLLLREMRKWVDGSWYEKRAVAAALAEPRLLKGTKIARQVLDLLDRITLEMETARERRNEAFDVLRKAMGYCWSVAIVAFPDDGKARMEKWLATQDRDILWVMKENLKKNRLVRMDEKWVQDCRGRVERI